MLDDPSIHPATSSERLTLLRSRRTSWRTLALGTPTASIHLRGACQAYDLVGGYFFKCVGPDDTNQADINEHDRRSLTIVALPSTNPPREVKVETRDLGLPTRDFATDPSQDLMVLFQMPAVDGRIRLHLRRLTEPEVSHPETSVDVLQGRVESVQECMLDIADDVIALYVRALTPKVIIFNWKTNETLVVSEVSRF